MNLVKMLSDTKKGGRPSPPLSAGLPYLNLGELLSSTPDGYIFTVKHHSSVSNVEEILKRASYFVITHVRLTVA